MLNDNFLQDFIVVLAETCEGSTGEINCKSSWTQLTITLANKTKYANISWALKADLADTACLYPDKKGHMIIRSWRTMCYCYRAKY